MLINDTVPNKIHKSIQNNERKNQSKSISSYNKLNQEILKGYDNVFVFLIS